METDKAALYAYADHLGATLPEHPTVVIRRKHGKDDFTIADEPAHYEWDKSIDLGVTKFDQEDVITALVHTLHHNPMINEGERARKMWHERRIGGLGLTLMGGLGTSIAGAGFENVWASRGGTILAIGAAVGGIINSMYKDWRDKKTPAIPEDYALPIRITKPEE